MSEAGVMRGSSRRVRGAAVSRAVACPPGSRGSGRRPRPSVVRTRACAGPVRSRWPSHRRRRAVAPALLDRVLAGVAVTVCSAAVVVLLGLIADAVAGPAGPVPGPSPVPVSSPAAP